MSESGEPEIRLVRRIFNSWGPTSDRFWASFEEYFDDETVWENVGLARTVGLEEALAFARGFPLDFAYMSVELLNVAARGEVVLNERIDHFHKESGEIVASIRVAGMMQVRNGKIVEWRDYFDTASLPIAPLAITASASAQ